MALNLSTFKTDLKAALLTAQGKNQKDGVDIDTALGNLSDAMAVEIDKYIKTATVNVTSVTTTVTGTCATPGGAGTIAGTGSGTGTGNLQ